MPELDSSSRWVYWAVVVTCGSILVSLALLLELLIESQRGRRPLISGRLRVAIFLASMACTLGLGLFSLLRR